MEEHKAMLAQTGRTALYLSIYIFLSGAQIFFNKWVLSPSGFNFPFPITLTTCHMIFSTLLCILIFHVFKIRKLAHELTLDQYFKSVFPVGAMFAMTLWFGNTAFLFISIAFAQMLKACMPVVVLLISAAVGLEDLTLRMLGIMCVISVGVLIASVGEISFSWAGVVYQMLGVVGEAGRLILAELLLKKRGVSMDPLSMMYYVSPASAACLLVPWYFLEFPRLLARTWPEGEAGPAGDWSVMRVLLASIGVGTQSPLQDVVVLFLNALCTFALNLSVFLVILHTSAVTIRVAGVVKDWLVVLLSALVFMDTRLTPINIFGYAIAITGVVMYNNTKLKAQVAAAAAAASATPLSPAPAPSAPAESASEKTTLLPSPREDGRRTPRMPSPRVAASPRAGPS